MTLVILAAGLGRRFGGSKQTFGVGPRGEWLLDYAIFDAWRAGFRDVVLIIRPGTHEEFDTVRDRWRDRVTIRFAEQRLDDLPAGFTPGSRTKPWGTGHALLAARDLITGPFAVINADDFYGRDAYALAAAAMPAAAAGDATIVGMRLIDTLSPHGAVTRGIVETDGDRVTRVTEKSGITRDTSVSSAPSAVSVSMNFWVFPKTILDYLSQALTQFLAAHGQSADAEILLPTVVNDLIHDGRLTVRLVTAPGPWLGLTHPDDRQLVEAGLKRMADEGTYPVPIWAD